RHDRGPPRAGPRPGRGRDLRAPPRWPRGRPLRRGPRPALDARHRPPPRASLRPRSGHLNARISAVLWALPVVALCASPGSEIPGLDIVGIDKVGHSGVFFVGAILWMQAWPRSTARVLAAGLAVAMLTEIYQGLMPFLGRFPDP